MKSSFKAMLNHLILFLAYRTFDLNKDDNLVAYWGQDSYSGSNEKHGIDPKKKEKTLSRYCEDSVYDVIVLSFMTEFNIQKGGPKLNFGKHCLTKFPNSDLIQCPQLEEEIKFCRSRGKVLLLSLGGYTGDYKLESKDQATKFAHQLWDMFLGGTSDMRPFGDAQLDGIDLDIEKGNSEHYLTLTKELKSIYDKESKDRKYYLTAAPQCVYPDEYLKSVLDQGWLDMVFVQFYNNKCDLNKEYNYEKWDQWSVTTSKNKNVKLFVGIPGSSGAATSGYLDFSDLGPKIEETRKNYGGNFGGVSMWDVSQADANYCKETKASYSKSISAFLKRKEVVDLEVPSSKSRKLPSTPTQEKQKPNLVDMENQPTQIPDISEMGLRNFQISNEQTWAYYVEGDNLYYYPHSVEGDQPKSVYQVPLSAYGFSKTQKGSHQPTTINENKKESKSNNLKNHIMPEFPISTPDPFAMGSVEGRGQGLLFPTTTTIQAPNSLSMLAVSSFPASSAFNSNSIKLTSEGFSPSMSVLNSAVPPTRIFRNV